MCFLQRRKIKKFKNILNESPYILSNLSLANRDMLKKYKLCGCYYCKKIFNYKKITYWIKDKKGDTAVCPYCDVDYVVSVGVLRL